MSISGHTQPYAVLGYPIGHTLSPLMHNEAFRQLGWDAIYLAFSVRPEHLMRVLESMAQMGFAGVNLTIPLKEVAFLELDTLDETAQLLGAVNTIRFNENEIKGYNTDGIGFLRAIDEAFGLPLNDCSLFVLGAGGAGRAVALASAAAGARELMLHDADPNRCQQVAEEIKNRYPSMLVQAVDKNARVDAVRTANVVVQATPIGMRVEDASPLPEEAFTKDQKLFDLIYMYPETATMRVAKKSGAACANGLGMLLHQGVEAFKIWTNETPPIDAMRAALEKAVYTG